MARSKSDDIKGLGVGGYGRAGGGFKGMGIPKGFKPITRIAFVGDSTTAEAGAAGFSPLDSGTSVAFDPGWATAVLWATGREIPITLDKTSSPHRIAFAASGQKSDHVLSTQIPALLASTPLPSHVFWKIGTNDVSQKYSVALSESNIRTGIAQLKAAGIDSIITTINPRSASSGNAADVASFNNLLQTIASETGSMFIDHRPLMEISPGVMRDGSLNDSVHQWTNTNYAMAAEVANAISNRLSPLIKTPFDLGPLLHDQSVALTGQTSTVAREDGVAGNWRRFVVTSSPAPITIGTGNSGVTYTLVGGSGLTYDQISVYHRTNISNNNFTAEDPRVSVFTTDTGRTHIEVRAATTGLTATTSAQKVVNAINAHPVASLLVTASLTGDGTGVMAAGDGWTAFANTLSSAPTNPNPGQWVRAVAEILTHQPSRELRLRLNRSSPSFVSPIRDLRTTIPTSSINPPARLYVLTTPWLQIAEGESGWAARLEFRRDLGTYDVGRFGVQVYQP
jgi:hypothetical protein